MMVHNPLTVAIGDTEEMRKAIGMLDEVKEAIINAYESKTKLSRAKLSHLMDAETWLSAHRAIDLGFADGMLVDEKRQPSAINASSAETYAFSRRAVTNSLLDKVRPKLKHESEPESAIEPSGIPIESLDERLSLILR